jgi:ribosomal RNA small subunit methyltransferase A
MEFSKHRGQHFLTDKNIVKKIIAAAELAPTDTVLEVGPGLGVLTREILPRVARLVAVELDPLFVYELRKSFPEIESREGAEVSPRLEIIEGDILKMQVPDLFSSHEPRATSYKLITNLPYNITSAFLKKFLIEPPAPERIVVMLQKEVAERIIFTRTKNQEPISSPTNLLGLMCNLYAECSFVCNVSHAAFVPPPKVDSAVICLKPYSTGAFSAKWGLPREASAKKWGLPREASAKWGIDRGLAEDIVAFVSKFYAAPRKKMCGALGKSLREKCRNALVSIGENPDSRPAELTLQKWIELWKKLL